MTSPSPERALILVYSPSAARGALAALLALDDALALVLRTMREPALGQMRLAWWREALERLDHAPPPGEPVLRALAAEALPLGVSGRALGALVDGWDVLIEAERLDREALARFAEGRGALFEVAGGALAASAGDPLRAAGQGWALADLARNLDDPDEAAEAQAMAAPLLGAARRRALEPQRPRARRARASRAARSAAGAGHGGADRLAGAGGAAAVA